MIVNISVIPGSLNKNIDKHRKVTPIIRNALCTLLKQNGSPQMEIIVELPNGESLFRRKYPDPEYPGETKEQYCTRVQKEIKKIV